MSRVFPQNIFTWNNKRICCYCTCTVLQTAPPHSYYRSYCRCHFTSSSSVSLSYIFLTLTTPHQVDLTSLQLPWHSAKTLPEGNNKTWKFDKKDSHVFIVYEVWTFTFLLKVMNVLISRLYKIMNHVYQCLKIFTKVHRCFSRRGGEGGVNITNNLSLKWDTTGGKLSLKTTAPIRVHCWFIFSTDSHQKSQAQSVPSTWAENEYVSSWWWRPVHFMWARNSWMQGGNSDHKLEWGCYCCFQTYHGRKKVFRIMFTSLSSWAI